ncbi:SDR family NAD(P)-dependent oxidoreductase [Mesorhizobium sp. SARCC-RB16n]|uniref:SDR family NAD(P)-dependent oxidoreductase n=1 Tax=Mesorhizobium sp. SARCC-RB16n TaxID=2116687 RepID=UPI001662ACBB|nr:SDR family oxidoreductase [Mesorhizobium sp. SARCC-RB16n]
MTDLFSGEVIVVTGAASGIGAATARALARSGAKVVLADRADCADLAESLSGHAVRVDVSDEASVAALMREAGSITGSIHGLVNNAGVTCEVTIDATTAEDFQRMMAVNAMGTLFGIKHGARWMRGTGTIVNTASLAGMVGIAGYGSYAASKAAVISLTQTAAMEYGPRGIRVNCICPSSVETPMLHAQANAAAERALSRLSSPLGKVMTADEVAAVILFLASPLSQAMTGQALNVDGGGSAGWSMALLGALIGEDEVVDHNPTRKPGDASVVAQAGRDSDRAKHE